MNSASKKLVAAAERAALEVLLHNAEGPANGLPRTAGWGYPEPYTRDLLISAFGIAAAKNTFLLDSLKNVLQTLARNQSGKGHIPSLVNDSEDRGASDTTPLFLIATHIYRETVADPVFLEKSVKKALKWMAYQSPTDRSMVAQLPTSDWRDEQWVLGYGLFVNTLVYSYLCLYGKPNRAERLRREMEEPVHGSLKTGPGSQEGLALPDKPYYALWSYKVYCNRRFDLLGNSLAILTGLVSGTRASDIIDWVEDSCRSMNNEMELDGDLPPNFFPFMEPGDADWRERYTQYNQPGNYHNGGVWPFITAFYIAALVSLGKQELAEQRLLALTRLVVKARNPQLAHGFNEWYKAQDGRPMGQDWQTWSASNYLYAARCVATRRTPFFEGMRKAAK